MATPPSRLLRPLPLLLLAGMLSAVLPGPVAAGPLVRRAQERRACQEFAGKLQQASANPALAQQVYQQGVLQLVQRFGENPCGEIPAPTASGATATPRAGAAAATPPASGAAAATPPATTPAGGSSSTSTGQATPGTSAAPAGSATGGSPAAPAASAQQQQACQQFAGKLQAAAASGGAAAAQQTYAMGLQKLSGMFGSNPCPNVRAPQ